MPAGGTHSLEGSKVKVGQDMERMQAGKEYSRPVRASGRDCSGHANKARQQEALTSWRWKVSELFKHEENARQQGTLTRWRGRRSGLVGTCGEGVLVRGTHYLEGAEVGTGQKIQWKRTAKGTHFLNTGLVITNQHMTRMPANDGGLLPRWGKCWDWSEHGKNSRKRGAFTFWRGYRPRLIKT